MEKENEMSECMEERRAEKVRLDRQTDRREEKDTDGGKGERNRDGESGRTEGWMEQVCELGDAEQMH